MITRDQNEAAEIKGLVADTLLFDSDGECYSIQVLSRRLNRSASYLYAARSKAIHEGRTFFDCAEMRIYTRHPVLIEPPQIKPPRGKSLLGQGYATHRLG
jgi:hypothetical protein